MSARDGHPPGRSGSRIGALVSAVRQSGQPAARTRAAARLMSLLENEPQRLADLLGMAPAGSWPMPQLILGVTGAPGSGKSSLTDALLFELKRRRPEARVGVLAVDPSSPFTGGAVLGDRVRMMRHATDPKIFIRSVATRGHLGGLALGVRGILRVMGLLGCETVIVETVGVGQSEVEVARVADLVLIVLAPGQGDAVQMLKAGLMEIGDLFVVNKSDREGATALHRLVLATLAERPAPATPGRLAPPEVHLVSATEGTGVEALADALDAIAGRHRAAWAERRRDEALGEVREAVLEIVRRRTAALLADGEAAEEPLRRVLRGELTAEAVAAEVIIRAGNGIRQSAADGPEGGPGSPAQQI